MSAGPRIVALSTSVVIAILVCVGCSDDGATTREAGDATDATCRPQLGPVLCSAWSVGGDVQIEGRSGGVIALPDVTCADWASGSELRDDGSLELPSAYDPVGGQDVDVFNAVSDYTGPGTYDLAQLSGLDGAPFAITAGDLAYQASDASTATLTIGSDGSGELVFTGFIDTGGPELADPGIEGSISWSCVDPG